jgi:methionine-rich copper-binding protein CopC
VSSAVLALCLATAAAVLAAAPPAAAHGALAMSRPADGATVTEPLTAVELYFTERVASNAYFTITAPGGGRVDNGWTVGSPKPLDKPVREYFMVEGKFEPREYTTGFPAVVAVAHLPAAGRYSVSYLSVASDGEAVRGTTTFRYTGKATPAPQGWTPPSNQPDPSLLALAEQHGMAGQGSTTSGSGAPTTPASSTPVAPAPIAGADGGAAGWVTWAGWAVAVAALAGGFVLWRRRPGAVGKPASRTRTSGSPRPRSGSRSAAKAAAAGRKPAAAASAGGTTRSGGKDAGRGRRPAAVPAARKGGTVVTATAAPQKPDAQSASPPGTADADAGIATVNGVSVADLGDAAPASAPAGGGLGNFRLAVLVGGLVLALLAGFGLGRIGAGDDRDSGAPAGNVAASGPAATGGTGSAMAGHQHAAGTGPHSHPGDANTAQASGTTVSAGGYTLQPAQRTQPVGATVDYRFRIVGADRQAATRFKVVHDKPLHMIVVGRDLSGYQHLHPAMASDGTWSIPLKLVRAGSYRVYADFSLAATDGTQLPLVLGVDHHVPGTHTPAALPPAASQATTGPFTVSMEGTPTMGVTAPLYFRVSRTGAPGPSQLERYLGAYGHLVVVREGDLGYVHVHPEPDLVDGAAKFWLAVPSPGRYRASFDFQVAGKVQTAQYTIDLP